MIVVEENFQKKFLLEMEKVKEKMSHPIEGKKIIQGNQDILKKLYQIGLRFNDEMQGYKNH